MDAAQTQNYAEVRSCDEGEVECIPNQEVAMINNNEAVSPLPLAMRVEEISERDLNAILRAAETTPDVVRRLRRDSSRMTVLDVVTAR